MTRLFVKACANGKTKILDTRKTLPLFRKLEKQAVVHGGGENHRMSLSDQAMLKENHLRMFGGDIIKAVKQVRSQAPMVKVVVETTSLDEVKQAIESQCDRVLLDNMPDEMMREALKLIPASMESEASGNMSLERIPQVAKLGVSYISVGSITHSAPTADMSLLFDWETQDESN